MPKKIKESKIHFLFRYIKAPKVQKEIMVSAPNKLNDLQTKVIEEVNQKLSIIEELSEKNYDQQHLLALMKTIKKFSEKEKTFENMSILEEMMAMYKEKNIDWDCFQPLPSAEASIQDTPKISLFQQQLQLQATKLKPVNKIDIIENGVSAKQESNQTAFFLKPDDIARCRLKPVQHTVTSNKKEEPSEFAQAYDK